MEAENFFKGISNNTKLFNDTSEPKALRENKICSACGKQNVAVSKFCAFCGNPFPQEEQSFDIDKKLETQPREAHSIQMGKPPKSYKQPTQQLEPTQKHISETKQKPVIEHVSTRPKTQSKKIRNDSNSDKGKNIAVNNKNTKIVYAEKRSGEKDGKIIFKDLNKNIFYIDKEMTEAFANTLAKQRGWAWIEANGNDAKLIKRKSSSASNKYNLEHESAVFEHMYKIGDELYAPILTDSAETYRLVSIGPSLYGAFQLENLPDELKDELFQKWDIFKFKITNILRTETGDLKIELVPIGKGCIVNEKPKAEEKAASEKTEQKITDDKKDANSKEIKKETPEKTVSSSSYISDYIYSDPNGKSKLIQANISDKKNKEDLKRVDIKKEEKSTEKVIEKSKEKDVSTPTAANAQSKLDTTHETAETKRLDSTAKMIYAKYVGVVNDKNNEPRFRFIDAHGGNIYLLRKFCMQRVTESEPGIWYWINKHEGYGYHIEYRKTDKEKQKKSFGYEINLFKKNYKVGDIDVFPIGDIKEGVVGEKDYMQVFISANCSSRVYADSLPEGMTLSRYKSGDLYHFRILSIDTDAQTNRITVNLTPVGRFQEKDRTAKKLSHIPDDLIETCSINLSSFKNEIDNVFWDNLENTIGEKLTEGSFRKYLNKLFKDQKQNNTLNISINAKETSIDIDLGVKNGKGVPQKAGINCKNGRSNDFYLALIGAVDPGSFFEKRIFIEDWEEITKELSEMALPENWGKNGHILKSYLKHTFYKVWLDGELVEEGDNAIFNTGLVDYSYDDIYCYLKKCENPNNTFKRKWEIGYFACWGKRSNGKKLNETFTRKPNLAKYIKDGQFQNLYLDVSKFGSAENLSIDYEHIIKENIKRFPIDFIKQELSADEELNRMIDNGEYPRKWMQYIRDNDALVRKLQRALKEPIELAIKYCKWNYKTAIPIYYARTNNISLLLPLKLTDTENPNKLPDIALVIERYANGNFQGQTILTMDMAYKDARLICRPNSEWLGIPDEDSEDNEEDIE